MVSWGNIANENRGRGYDHESAEAVRKIFREGTDAIPDLVALCDDRRITLHVSSQINNRPESRDRLGHLAKRLLREMTGATSSSGDSLTWPDWLETASLDDEKLFFEHAAFQFVRGKIKKCYQVPLRILARKYPQSLPDLANLFTDKAAPGTHPWGLAESIRDSGLTRQEKLLTLAMLTKRRARGRPSFLLAMYDVDPSATKLLLAEMLREYPVDIDEGQSYWNCSAVSIRHTVGKFRDRELWSAYLSAAQKAAPGLRLELMVIYEANDNLYYHAFLATLLNDTTIRDQNINAERYAGPSAGDDFPRLSVQNFAAIRLAGILGFLERPDEEWSADQLNRLRQQVVGRINSMELPDLGSR